MTKRTRVIAGIALAVVVAIGIVAFRGRGSGNNTTRTAPVPTGNSPSEAPPDPSVTSVTLGLTPIATVEAPTDITARPGDTSLYVTEQAGRIRRVRRAGDSYTLDDAPVLDITSEVTSGGEQGLLGLAFSADGSHLYFAFTNSGADQQVDEVALDGDRVVQDSRRTLLVVPDFAPNHNGGNLVLGPDGFLYYSMGDGGGGGDPRKSGQDPSDLLGDILRIDPTKPAGDKAYGIPPDNPFADGVNGAPEVWQYGLRNPWRFSFDRTTKDLWIGDVGQGEIEEIDFLAAGSPSGANFGWNAVEGTEPFSASGPPPGAIPPVYEYTHSGGRCSVTGGFVYRGRAIKALQGTYLFGDNCDGNILGLDRASDGTVTVTPLNLNVKGLSSFGEDNDGEMYAVGVVDGSISRIDVASGTTKARSEAGPAPTPVALSDDPTTAADQLAAAEVVIHDPDATDGALAAAVPIQQLAYRHLGRMPELFDMIIGRAPPSVQDAIRLNLDARNELALIPGGKLQDTLPAWRIIAPAPKDELLAAYKEAEQQFGVGWNYLAAINLIETAMGRIEGLSSAGAQGPMQFMPATWAAYGDGGDINSVHDSIMGAARYLAANGFADGNVDGSLFRYNNTEHYVNAIKDIAAVLAADPTAFAGYYRWEVFYVTTMGDVHLPVGYETPDRIPVTDYLATHPQN